MKRRLAALLSTVAVGAGTTTCSVPAHADPKIPAAAEAGQVDGGWVRVVCSGTTADQRCHLRFPDGFRRLDTRLIFDGEDTGEVSTWDHDTPGRVRDRIRRFKGSPVTGVRVSCWTAGAWVSCTVRVHADLVDYRETYWSAGSNMGGLIWEAYPTTTPTRSPR